MPPNPERDSMVADLRLNSENTDMPLRDRIRFAMMEQKRHWMWATAVSNAKERDLTRLKAAAELLGQLMESRIRYSEHMSRLSCPQPCHLHAFLSIGDQIADAEERLNAIEIELFMNDCPEPDSRVFATIMRTFLGTLVHQDRIPHPSVLRLLGEPVV